MNFRLVAIGVLAALAGVIGALAFVPGAIDGLLPKRGDITVGKALIGGPFELTSHDGKRVRDAKYRGKLMLVYFGFTYCPDICPAGLQVISAALDNIGAQSDKVAPLFITVDPERDTPEQLKSYVSSFHPSLTGLTGSAADISAAAKAYRVYYRKAQDPSLSEYTMDHTSFVYLMDDKGDFITHFPHAVTPDKLAARLKAELEKL
ncbi:MAG: cytochrome oxidase Cu insertion factor (SCO1/SenC/PrrC family) [Hyphomicrobiaceae bacterium]|jgi:cytochrome oxidase Cu insertion factor (SCO1/SenC/PrrC family)